MKREFVVMGIVFLFFASLVFTSAAYSDSVGVSASAQVSASRNGSSIEGGAQTPRVRDLAKDIRENRGWFNVSGKNITVRMIDAARAEIIAGKINARTGLNLTAEDIQNGTLGQILSAYLSNGRKAFIKIMPDRASAVALARLRAKCLQNNCTVELKEVGNGNKSRLAYELNTTKGSKLFFIFNKRMPVQAQVDAETGQVIAVKRPWWSFLAKEKDDNDGNETQIEEELNGSVSG